MTSSTKAIGNIWVYAADNIKMALPSGAGPGDVYIASVSEGGDLEVTGPVGEDPPPATGAGARFVCTFTIQTPTERIAARLREAVR